MKKRIIEQNKRFMCLLLVVILTVLLAGCQTETFIETSNKNKEIKCSVCGETNSVLNDFCSACGCELTSESGNSEENSENMNNTSSEVGDQNMPSNYNTHGDFQSSLFGMAIEGDWLFYRNYFDSNDGIKRTLVNGGEYSKHNIETVFNPSLYQKDMAEKMGWNNADFYEASDIISINNLQVVENWVYWASDCAIWRFPNLYDADIFDLELVAIIGVPERPTCTNFYVDGEWIYFACNAIKERFDSSTALVEHTLCKLNLKTKERVVLASAPSTNERLGDLYGNEYYKLMDLKTVCSDGRIYFSNYTKEYIYFYKDGKEIKTRLKAYTINSNSFTDSHDETRLYSSKEGYIAAIYGYWADPDYYYFKDENLSKGTAIEELALITDDGYYYESYIHRGSSSIPYYDGLYKSYFDGRRKKITNDQLYPISPATIVAGVCGDYLYYYTNDKALCRMSVDGTNWEDVSWMIE